MKHFDYIIVGAGAAGCVVANRLSSNPNVSVCLIEAGGSDRSPWVQIPAGIFGLYGNKRFDYAYQGVPQKHLANRVMTVNRGKALGGSTSINSMVYIRGNKNDYDGWAALGCDGWSYADVLPVFKDIEHNTLHQNPDFHGLNGEVNVTQPQDVNPVARTFIEAGKGAHLPENTDFNAESQLGLGIYNVTQNKGERVSSYTAFVKPILSRSNLTLFANTEVFSLEINNDRVMGVVIEQDGQRTTLTCQQEVILCSGAIASPRILLASGIGHRDELDVLGIQCKQHVPGVGENLQDHVDSMVTVRSSSSVSIGVSFNTLLPHVFPAPFKYWLQRKGWWTTNYVEAGGFAKTRYALEAPEGSAEADPDVQFHFTPLYRSHRGKRFEWGHGYSVFTCVLRPKSTGTVKLANDGMHRNVLIDHQFFSNEQDQKVLIEGVRKAREILASSPFDAIRGEEMAPGEQIQTDEQILDYLRRTASTVYHPVGTCKMGVDDLAVVSPQNLKVKGMVNLRIADASVMPKLISGNTANPSMMIGERCARMVLADAELNG